MNYRGEIEYSVYEHRGFCEKDEQEEAVDYRE